MEAILNRTFSPLFDSACRRLFYEPLFRHGDAILCAAHTNDELYELLVAAAAASQQPDVVLRITLCGPDSADLERWLRKSCPMYGELESRGLMKLSFIQSLPEMLPSYVLCPKGYVLPAQAGIWMAEADPEEGFLHDDFERLAENSHYTYEVSYNSKRSYKEIVDSMYMNRYFHASTLAGVANIPVKLHYAGVDEADYARAASLYEERLRSDPALRNRLVFQEHMRWTAYTALIGYSKPTYEEIAGYAFMPDESGKLYTSFRMPKKGLHPALAECDISCVDALSGRPDEFWDAYDPQRPYPGLDELSRVSLWQHWHARNVSADHRIQATMKLNELDLYKPGVGDALKAIGMLSLGENRSADLDRALALMSEHFPSATVRQISDLTRSSVEAVKRRSYLQGDIFAIDTLGFVLVYRKSYKRLICSLSAVNINGLAALDPAQAVFIVPPLMTRAVLNQRKRDLLEFIRVRRLRTKVSFVGASGSSISAAADSIAAAREALDGPAVFDLTGATPALAMAAADQPSFLCDQSGRLIELNDCPGIECINSLERPLNIDELFAAMGRTRQAADWKITDMTGIERHIRNAFDAYISIDNAAYIDLCNLLHKQAEHIKGGAGQDEKMSLNYSVSLAADSSGNITGTLRRLAHDGFIEKLSVTADSETVAYSFDTRYKNIASAIFESGRNAGTFSAKFKDDGKKREPVLRYVPDSFESPCDPKIAGVLKAFTDAGCFIEEEDGRYRYAATGLKGIFAQGNTGTLLEDFLYWAVKSNPHYREVRLSFSFAHVTNADRSEHEIDVMAITDRGRPCFFSCKLGSNALNKAAADEVGCHAVTYDIRRPIGVLVSTADHEVLEKKDFSEGRADRMSITDVTDELGIEFIDRSTLSDWDMLQDALTRIANG